MRPFCRPSIQQYRLPNLDLWHRQISAIPLVILPVHLDPNPGSHEANARPAGQGDRSYVPEPRGVADDANELADGHNERGDESAVDGNDVEEDEQADSGR